MEWSKDESRLGLAPVVLETRLRPVAMDKETRTERMMRVRVALGRLVRSSRARSRTRTRE